jgi:hypothetical protein
VVDRITIGFPFSLALSAGAFSSAARIASGDAAMSVSTAASILESKRIVMVPSLCPSNASAVRYPLRRRSRKPTSKRVSGSGRGVRARPRRRGS